MTVGMIALCLYTSVLVIRIRNWLAVLLKLGYWLLSHWKCTWNLTNQNGFWSGKCWNWSEIANGQLLFLALIITIAHTHARTYAHTHTHARTYARTHTHTHMCIHICMHTNTHTHTFLILFFYSSNLSSSSSTQDFNQYALSSTQSLWCVCVHTMWII